MTVVHQLLQSHGLGGQLPPAQIMEWRLVVVVVLARGIMHNGSASTQCH